MHEILISFWGVHITGWKIVGYFGVLLFSGRWFVQLWASRKGTQTSRAKDILVDEHER